jgi:hypothetical protein
LGSWEAGRFVEKLLEADKNWKDLEESLRNMIFGKFYFAEMQVYVVITCLMNQKSKITNLLDSL